MRHYSLKSGDFGHIFLFSKSYFKRISGWVFKMINTSATLRNDPNHWHPNADLAWPVLLLIYNKHPLLRVWVLLRPLLARKIMMSRSWHRLSTVMKAARACSKSSILIFVYATEEVLSTATDHVKKQQLQQAAAQASFSCLVAPFKNLALT